MARKPETKTAEQAEPAKTEEPKVQETTEDPKAEEPKAKEPKAEAPKDKSKLVKIYNPQRYFYVQPSTGIKINAKAVTEVRDDNWLALQLDAKVLQKAR